MRRGPRGIYSRAVRLPGLEAPPGMHRSGIRCTGTPVAHKDGRAGACRARYGDGGHARASCVHVFAASLLMVRMARLTYLHTCTHHGDARARENTPGPGTRRINAREGKGEDRHLLTGKHTVCDVFCIQCHRLLGWKYVRRGGGGGTSGTRSPAA